MKTIKNQKRLVSQLNLASFVHPTQERQENTALLATTCGTSNMKRLQMLSMTCVLILLVTSCKTACQLTGEKQVFIDGFNTEVKSGGVQYGFTYMFLGGHQGYRPKDPNNRVAKLYIEMQMSDTNRFFDFRNITLNDGSRKYMPTSMFCYLSNNKEKWDLAYDEGLAILPKESGLYTIELGYIYMPPTRFKSISVYGRVYNAKANSKTTQQEFEELARLGRLSKNGREVELNTDDTQVDIGNPYAATHELENLFRTTSN